MFYCVTKLFANVATKETTRMKFFAKNPLLIAIITAILTLSGCQTIAQHSSTQTAQAEKLTAHQLMRQTMIGRFDKSYDYEKTTKYQIDTLYNEQDIEAKDHSLMLALLNNYFSDYTNEKAKRNLSAEELACEASYESAYNDMIDDYIAGDIDETALNDIIFNENKKYIVCVEQAQASINESKVDQATIDEALSKLSHEKDYRKAIQRFIDKLNEINAHNAPLDNIDDKTLDNDEDFSIGSILTKFQLTPEQIQVINDSYIQPQVIDYKGSYNKDLSQFSTVLEEKSQQQFSERYKRIPVLVDMNELSITFEPDIILPMASILFDKELPEDLAGKSVKLYIPEDLKQNIPLVLLKDSLIKSIGQAYGDIDPEKFSDVLIDEYARSIEAKRVIKINMNSRDFGFLLGRTLKYWTADLQKISKQHPEYIENNEDFRLALELFSTWNKIYRADDLAKIAQLVETILPISYQGYNYYYFDKNNQLIAYRKINSYHSNLLNAKAKTITTNKITYTQGQTVHKYYQPKPTDVIDGNKLLDTYLSESNLKKQANYARLSYDYEDVASDIACETEDGSCVTEAEPQPDVEINSGITVAK